MEYKLYDGPYVNQHSKIDWAQTAWSMPKKSSDVSIKRVSYDEVHFQVAEAILGYQMLGYDPGSKQVDQAVEAIAASCGWERDEFYAEMNRYLDAKDAEALKGKSGAKTN